ncbi:MAG: hypothetical protein E6Q88_02555 [Lysobacteraceae bacterium]|nr:MAG: hypothetical protein E6Q88_02555 [Xanthomonadaceae bacterium]
MGKMKKTLIGLTLAAVMGAAVAAAPGPTTRGEFYYYLDNTGKVIGYRAINCNGTFVSWGKTSSLYSKGYMLCLPVD